MPGVGTRIAACLAAVAAGCRGQEVREGFDAPDANARTDAILETGAAGAPPLHALVEQLGADDPLVRMTAIVALERATGTTRGYVHYAPEPQRTRAQAEWVAWLTARGAGEGP